MPNLAKKFAPNTEAFGLSQKNNTAMGPFGCDYVDTRSFNVDITQSPYNNSGDPSNTYTAYPTYYGYNVGRVTGFDEEYASYWVPGTIQTDAWMRKNLPFDSFVSNAPLIQHDYDSFTDTYPNAVDSAAAGGQAIKHNGGYWEQRNMSGGFDRPYSHWHREQAYHVVAHSYTTETDSALRTANDYKLVVKVYGSAYLAEVYNTNNEPIYDRDILGFNFLEPYDDDVNNPTQTPNVKRLQTKYNRSFDPESYPDFGLVELLSKELTGSTFEINFSNLRGTCGTVTDVRWVNFEEYTDSPGSTEAPTIPVWLPRDIEILHGERVTSLGVVWTPFYLQDPNDSNNLLKFYKIDDIAYPNPNTSSTKQISSIGNSPPFTSAISFEWAEDGSHCYFLAEESSALSTNGDAIIARCRITNAGTQSANYWDWGSLQYIEHIYLPDSVGANGFWCPSKLNLSRNFQAYRRVNGPTTSLPGTLASQLAFTASLGVYDVFTGNQDSTSNGKSQILNWEVNDVNNEYSISNHQFVTDGTGNSQLMSLRGIAGSRSGWQGPSGFNLGWVASWRNLVHAQRPFEHQEVQQMLFANISAKSYVSDPEGLTGSNRYYIQAIKVPDTLESRGTAIDDLQEDQGKKINTLRKNSEAVVKENKYQTFPWVEDVSGDNVRHWDYGSYCSVWSPDGKLFIWFGLSVYDDAYPDAPGYSDAYVDGDPFNYYYSWGDAKIDSLGLVLYQVSCTTPFDISTAQLNTVVSHKMYDTGDNNPFRGFTATQSGKYGGGNTELAYNQAFINPDRYAYSGISGQNTYLVNRYSPTGFGWGVPRKLKWVKGRSYTYPQTNVSPSGEEDYEHGFCLGIVWSGSYQGNDYTSNLYFPNDYNHLQANNDNRSSYVQNVYTELGFEPISEQTYADVPFDLRDKRPRFVFNGFAPQALDFRDLIFSSSPVENLYPISRFDDTTGTTRLYNDPLAGYDSTATGLTGNSSAYTQGFYLNDFDFYDDGNRCLVSLMRIAPAYTQMYADNGVGSTISPSRDAIAPNSGTEGDGFGIEIWVDLKLTEPYLLTESTASNHSQFDHWRNEESQFKIDASDSWFNTIDYQKGIRWSYLRSSMNPREVRLENNGRTMLRAAYPGIIQSVSRPRDYWVPSYVNDPDLATDTSLSAQVVRGGGLFGPYAYEKSKRNTQIQTRRSDFLEPDKYSAVQSLGYNDSQNYFSRYVHAYGDTFLGYVQFTWLRLISLETGVVEADFLRPTAATNQYGSAAAFNDDYVVIACYDQSNAGYTADGTVYVYDRHNLSSAFQSTQSQALLYTFTSPNPQNNGQFGYSVALKDNYLVVGAPAQDSVTVSSRTGMGVVYLYDLTNGSLVRTHENPETGWGNTNWGNYVVGNGERWGQSVGINSTHVAIGAPNQSNQLSITLYPNVGCIYMFKLSDGSQESNVSIKSFEWTDNNTRFGHHLVMTDTKLVSGTLITDYGASGQADSGEIALYDITQANIDNDGLNAAVSPTNYETKITDPNASSTNDNFFARGQGSTGTGPAQPFAMTDDFIVVAAFRDATTPRGDGVAYVYSTSGSLAATVLPTGDTNKYTSSDGFGNSVAITDSHFVVCYAGQRVQNVPTSRGSFYRYDLVGLQGIYDYFTYYPYLAKTPDTLNAFTELFADDRTSFPPGLTSINLDPTGQAPVLHAAQYVVRNDSGSDYRYIVQLKPKFKLVWSD